MNKKKWIILGIIIAVVAAALVILVPSVIATLLLMFIFELEALATFLILLTTIPMSIVLLLIAISWMILEIAKMLGIIGGGKTWPKNIVLSVVSIFSAFLSGLTLSKIGGIVITHYALEPIIGSIIYFIVLVLYALAASLALHQVVETKKQKWAYAVILIIFVSLGITGTISFYRQDYYDTATGNVKVYVTPSTGKIWWDKPESINYDPTTGEKLLIATKNQIKMAREKKEKTTSGPQADFVLKKGDKYTYKLGQNKATPWIEVPKGVTCNIAKKNFRVYYSNGHQPVDVREEDVILPDISPTIIKVGSHVPDNTIIITGT